MQLFPDNHMSVSEQMAKYLNSTNVKCLSYFQLFRKPSDKITSTRMKKHLISDYDLIVYVLVHSKLKFVLGA